MIVTKEINVFGMQCSGCETIIDEAVISGLIRSRSGNDLKSVPPCCQEQKQVD